MPIKKASLHPFLVVVLLISALMPVFLIPQIDNPLITSKWLLLIGLALLSALTYFAVSLKNGKWSLSLNPLFWPAVALIGFTVISSLLNFRYPVQQLLGMGGAYLAVGLLIIFLPNLLNKDDSQRLILPLNVIASVLSIISIFQVFGLSLSSVLSRLSVFTIPNDLSFSLTGSSLIALTFLSAVLVANLVNKKALKSSLVAQITVFLTLIGVGLQVWATFFNASTASQILPLSASLTVANNSLALSRTALFGVGPDAYSTAYNQLKPVWINGQDYWQFSFTSAFSQPLTMVVTGGLLGLGAWLALVWQALRLLFKRHLKDGLDSSNPYLAAFVLVLLTWLFLTPASILSLTLIAIALAFLVADNKDKYKEFSFSAQRLLSVLPESKAHKTRKGIFSLVSVLAMALVLWASIYYVGQVAAARAIYKTNVNLLNNQAAEAYTELQQAENLNRYSPNIRRSLSALNLEIAVALSNKTDLSAAEQEQVMQLLNQAVNEANAAILLDPYDYQNYLALANIYLQLVEVSDEAVTAAYEALAQAATYNPNEPAIRMQLGQLLFSQEQYAQAGTFFAQAAERKADLAAAHYWQAKSYEALEQYEDARTAYIKALTLLEQDSEDYKQANQEFEAMQKVMEELATQAQAEAAQGQAAGQAPTATPSPTPTEETASGLSNLIDQEKAQQLVNEQNTETLPEE